MNLHDLKELMAAFDASGIASLSFETDNCKLTLQKPAFPVPASTPVPMATTASPVSAQPPTPAPSGFTVTAPIVGVVYCAPAPGKTPFVSLGQSVKQGEILCLIEAMKMMNEVKAPVSGKIIEILFSDGELKEFGAPLFVIEE